RTGRRVAALPRLDRPPVGPIVMGLAPRLALGLILLLGAARAVAYLAYAVFALRAPFETYHLEAKMVLLAYRAQAGELLYPAWWDYPHVANFFSPLYFVLVGLSG